MKLSLLLAASIAMVAIEPVRAGQATGAIAGVIVSTDTPPQPVRRAIVTLTGGGIATTLSAVTDDRGRFTFQTLASGRYSLSASKPAYLKTAYGATSPGRPGSVIALAAGERVDVRIALPRGAVIAGVVRDLFGRPIEGVQVTVAGADQIDGPGGYLLTPESLFTDDRGTFRRYGLPPGEYVVSAVPRVGGSAGTFKVTSAEIDAILRALEQRDNAASPGAPYGYAPTYYPATTIAADAGRITVAAGEERTDVDISLVPVRAARVEGVIISGDIPPSRIRPTLALMGPPQPTFVSPSLTGPADDGKFAFSNVTPGRYVLTARTGAGAPVVLDARGTMTNNLGVAAMFAMEEVSIDGSDISGITLTLRPALTISGRVAFDATSLAPPESLTSLRIALTTAAASRATLLNAAPLGASWPSSAAVRADGTFTIAGVLPGTYGINSAVPGPAAPAGWWLRSVMIGDRDVLDQQLVLGPNSQDLSDVVVTFSDRHSELSGTLTSAAGQPASEYTVIVFSADRSHWRPGARRVRSLRLANDGAFQTIDLPAGEYLIAAVTDVEPGEWQRPSFLETLVPAAVKIAIAEGQRVRQDLRIAR